MTDENEMLDVDQDTGEIIEKSLHMVKVGTLDLSLIGDIPSLAEVVEELAPRGEDSKVEALEDEEIIVWTVEPFVGSYGPAAFLLITDAEGENLRNVVVGQKVALPKILLAEQENRLPVRLTFVKREGGKYGHYWDIE